jgi:hypothetical protein
MFCDGCGTAMSAEQKFCGACGKQIGVAPSPRLQPPPVAADGRVAKHLTIVAMLWIAIASLTLLIGLGLCAVGAFPFGRFIPEDAAPGVASIIHVVLLGIGGVVVLIAGAHFLAAWGLFRHAEWARIATIAFAFLRLLEFPLGTALGIYTIWVLMGPASEKEYRSLGPA